jgi:DNA-binding transcriptional regulator YiaG
MTQLQFAKTLGVSFQSVNRWERGKTKPLPIILKQIEVMVKEIDDKPNTILC